MTDYGQRTGTRTARRLCVMLLLLCPLLIPSHSSAQVRTIPSGSGSFTTGSTRSARSGGNISSGSPNSPLPTDSTWSQPDTSATKGLVFNKEIPDSVLRQKVFLFHHRSARIWIDEVWNPTLDPTGAQFWDPIDALDGNYYLGKGVLGHPHLALFPTLTDGIDMRLQPDLYPAYSYRMGNINFYQTLTPFSVLNYGGSLADDHSLRLTHTQNILPGWNIAFDYRLFNPEGVYASSGALNNYLAATTNYFSSDSRLQASAALIWEGFTIDENGGLATDSIFTQRLQSNRAGIPVALSGAGSLQRNLAAMGSASYSIERQSNALRHRDSLVAVQVNDSTTRIDTLDWVDTIPMHKPRILNAGVVGLELNYDRQKRVFADSTHWREQRATLFWTNDAYTSYRWHNPLKVTVGIQPRYVRAVIYGDTLRSYTWLNPFVRAELAWRKATLRIEAEQSQNPWSANRSDNQMAATLHFAFDSAAQTTIDLSAQRQDKTPDLIMVHDRLNADGSTLRNQIIECYSLHFKHKDAINLKASASHLSHNTWYDTLRTLHEGSSDLWLLQASLTLRLHAGPIHLDMQQLVQHSTDAEQLPLPLWMTKNSLYADFPLFGRTLRVQTGIDLRYHTPYHAPLYDPHTGLFLQQDELTVGGYLWADAFINLQVKRASIFIKAGHFNALWETPATYFLLPHYPGQRFGLQWGITWCFFD